MTALSVCAHTQGHARARFNLGCAYERGVGVEEDELSAFSLCELAAQQGFAPAQLSVGNMYRTGRGVEKSHADALEWYLVAARRGVAEAQYNFALMCFNGQGCAVDKKAALEWCEAAARSGHRPAVDKLPLWTRSPDRQKTVRATPPPRSSFIPIAFVVVGAIAAAFYAMHG